MNALQIPLLLLLLLLLLLPLLLVVHLVPLVLLLPHPHSPLPSPHPTAPFSLLQLRRQCHWVVGGREPQHCLCSHHCRCRRR